MSEGTRLLLFVATANASYLFVEFGTIVHPYLLADNRHYTFYLWRRILKFKQVRYALGMSSILSVWMICDALHVRHRRMWLVGFLICVTAVTVPSPLLELRYFTLPFLFMMLQMPMNIVGSFMLALSFASVNILTFYVFMEKHYTWADGSKARFMW